MFVIEKALLSAIVLGIALSAAGYCLSSSDPADPCDDIDAPAIMSFAAFVIAALSAVALAIEIIWMRF